jgi:hypothetical protein
MPAVTLLSVRAEHEGQAYTPERRGSKVVIGGANRSWASVDGDRVELTLGARVPEMLAAEIPTDDHDVVLARAALVAAICGHPRRDPRGAPIRFIWTDHVAIAAGRSANLAMRHTYVDTPQAQHMRYLEGEIHFEGVDE